MTNLLRGAAARLRARTRELVRSTYYSLGYGKDFPGRARLEARIVRWESGRGDVPKAKQAWDEQYAVGGWDFLTGISELAHYAVIVGYADFLLPGGAVLDVGCGSGVLHERFRSVGYGHYTGVDISESALERLRAQERPFTDFVAADADAFEPTRDYDVIVFNESLTYFPDPAATFRRYLRFLTHDGIAIVSCHVQSPRAQAILRSLTSAHAVLDETVVQQGANSWRVVAFAGRDTRVPRGPGSLRSPEP